ncbi:uncharacterized protein LOC127795787 [Diospyros lotus]|uniref:uncharacterized protein LOC127795787 n=1 Tax=Diospyros lotus TaxID=55363 RepID=UPI00224D5750|nr:uncharacterized protein LOC127795787 [Diospyros lotus]
MSGGRSPFAERQVTISLKLLVDPAKNRVIFAESDFEFIDTLLSFLTIPLGALFRVLGPDGTGIGSISRIRQSVSSLEVQHLRTAYCKVMLLSPRNASETQCSKLKLNIYPMEPAQLYMCDDHRYRFSTFKDKRCSCGWPMDTAVDIQEEQKAAEDGGGVFVSGGAARFIITDDLQVIPGSTAACIALFRKLGINNESELEERTVEIGSKEVLRLLKFALLSKSSLTESILLAQCSNTYVTFKSQQKKTAQSDKKDKTDNSNNMKLKLLMSKSKNRIIYAEAGVDMVDFLFSFLTLPIGSVIKLLGKNSGFGCFDNLYKSTEDLSAGSYMKSEYCKQMLLCPKLAPFFGLENKILQVEEASYVFHAGRRSWLLSDAKSESGSFTMDPLEERGDLPFLMDPKSPTGEVQAGKGYMKGPATFMITDDLFVTPFSPVTTIELLKKLNMAINDVMEREVTVGNDEALNLLRASLTSKTALNDIFNKKEPYGELMLKV